MAPRNVFGVAGLHRRPRCVVIDGKAIAAEERADTAARVRELVARGRPVPVLATVLIGDDPASAVYVKAKHRACDEVGIGSVRHHLPADISRAEALALIDGLNEDPGVAGILTQLPLPPHLDGAELTNRIDPGKDVDGLTEISAGRLALGIPGLRPCTPSGVMALLARTGLELEGRNAVVIGRSNLFGKPMAQMLTAADATVTLCHSRTREMAVICRQADVLIAAVGQPELVQGNWVKPGATVIDVGVNRTGGGLVGDVDYAAAARVAAAITPVPGGVGPMTIAFLMRNTVEAAEAASAQSATADNNLKEE
jgi:methylenetetrahydrofolate dehydrogenase (NADP+)/methenyltetrahydrofolate cyclohydrolase